MRPEKTLDTVEEVLNSLAIKHRFTPKELLELVDYRNGRRIIRRAGSTLAYDAIVLGVEIGDRLVGTWAQGKYGDFRKLRPEAVANLVAPKGKKRMLEILREMEEAEQKGREMSALRGILDNIRLSKEALVRLENVTKRPQIEIRDALDESIRQVYLNAREAGHVEIVPEDLREYLAHAGTFHMRLRNRTSPV